MNADGKESGAEKMMSYELFKNIAESRIKDYLPDEFRDYQVKSRTVRKVNQRMDCINLIPAGESLKVTPNLYLNDMYKEFEKSQDMNLVLHNAAAVVYYASKNLNPGMTKIDFSQWTNNIVINLVNTEENRELLEDLPHREVLDLSIIYRFIMGEDDSGLATVRIDNGILKEIQMTEEQLFVLALKNTKRMFPTVTEPLDNTRLVPAKGLSKADFKNADKMKEEMGDAIQFITNSVHIQGASCILYEEELFALAKKMKSSFYVMPSSVHEVVAVAEKLGEPKLLECMLRDANKQDFVGVDKLSDRVYYYSMEERTLSFAC